MHVISQIPKKAPRLSCVACLGKRKLLLHLIEKEKNISNKTENIREFLLKAVFAFNV